MSDVPDSGTPSQKVQAVVQNLRRAANGPTSEQLAEEIIEWLHTLDGHGIILTDENLVRQLLRNAEFSDLRKLFEQGG